MADGKPILHIDEIGMREKIEEELFLGLRRMQGVNKAVFQDKFGLPLDQYYRSASDELTDKQWLVESKTDIYLTDEGKLLANEVFEKFLLDEVFA